MIDRAGRYTDVGAAKAVARSIAHDDGVLAILLGDDSSLVMLERTWFPKHGLHLFDHAPVGSVPAAEAVKALAPLLGVSRVPLSAGSGVERIGSTSTAKAIPKKILW